MLMILLGGAVLRLSLIKCVIFTYSRLILKITTGHPVVLSLAEKGGANSCEGNISQILPPPPDFHGFSNIIHTIKYYRFE